MKLIKKFYILIFICLLFVFSVSINLSYKAEALSYGVTLYQSNTVNVDKVGEYKIYSNSESIRSYVGYHVTRGVVPTNDYSKTTSDNGEIYHYADSATSTSKANGHFFSYITVSPNIVTASKNGYAQFEATAQFKSGTYSSWLIKKDVLDKAYLSFAYGTADSVQVNYDAFNIMGEGVSSNNGIEVDEYQTINVKLDKIESDMLMMHAYSEFVNGGSGYNILYYRYPTLKVTTTDITSPSIVVNSDKEGWYNGTKKLTITITDSQSGIKELSVNGKTVKPITISSSTQSATYEYEVTSNGSYEIKVVDNVGNVATKTHVESGIDTEIPSATIEGLDVTWYAEYSFKLIQSNAIAPQSFYYTIDGSEPTKESFVASEDNTIVFPEIGEYIIKVKGFDEAGNESETLSHTVVYDNSEYILSVNIKNGTASEGGIYKYGNIVTIEHVGNENTELYSITVNGEEYTDDTLTIKITCDVTVDIIYSKKVEVWLEKNEYVFNKNGTVPDFKTSAESLDVFAIRYTKDGAPSLCYDVGTYIATYSVDSPDYVGSGELEFTIVPKNVSVKVKSTYEYSGSFVFDYTLSDEIDFNLSFTKDGEIIEPVLPGVYEYAFATSDSNYVLVESGTFEIVKRKVNIEVKYPEIYSGQTEELDIVCDVDVDFVAVLRYNGKDVESIVNAGEYSYNVDIVENALYEGKKEGSFIVAKRKISVIAQDKSSVYGQPLCDLTYTVDNLYEDIKFNISSNVQNSVGEYPILIEQVIYENYEITYTNAVYTVNPAQLTISVKEGQYKYYGAEDVIEYEVDGLLEGDQIDGSIERERGENVGFYNVMQGSLSVENYNITFESSTFSILPVQVVVKVDAKEKVYGEEDPKFSCEILFGKLFFDDVVEFEREEGENCGEYTIKASVNSNYILIPINSYLTINKAEVNVYADTVVTEYGIEGLLTYSSDVEVDFYGKLDREDGKNVGTYQITIGSLSCDNYNINFVGATYTITPKKITVKADNIKVTYGNNASLTYTVDGMLFGDCLSGELEREYSENVGVYEILQGSLYNTNYVIEFISGSYEIEPAPIVIDIESAVKTYGEKDVAFVYSVSGLIGFDEVNVKVEREEGEDVGNYRIFAESIDNANYYINSQNSGNLEITKKPVSFVLEDKKVVYDGKEQKIDEIETDLIIEYEYFRYGVKVDAPIDAGEYEVKATFRGNNNYTSATATAILTIEKRIVPIVIEEKSHKYTGDAIYPKYTLGIDIPVLIEFEDVDYAIDVGEYVYSIRTTEENYLLDIKGILIIE